MKGACLTLHEILTLWVESKTPFENKYFSKIIFLFLFLSMLGFSPLWWVSLGQKSNTFPAVHSHPPLSGRRGENKIRKLTG